LHGAKDQARYRNIMKRLLLYILVLIVLLALALSAAQWDKDTALLRQHADEISVWLAEQEKQAADLAQQQGAAAVIGGANAPFTLLRHRGDSLWWWSNNKAIPPAEQIKALGHQSGRQLLRLPLGVFVAQPRPLAGGASETLLIPLRYNDGFGGPEAGGPFPANPAIAAKVLLSDAPNEYPILADGRPLCWLSAPAGLQSAWLQWVKLGAYVLFFILFLKLLNQQARQLGQRFGPLAGALLLFVVVGAGIWLNGRYGFTQQQFGALALFQPYFEGGAWVGRSVGDWLAHAALLVFVMAFFHRRFLPTLQAPAPEPDPLELRPSPAPPEKGGKRLLLAGLCYLLAMLGVPLSMVAIGELVRHSRPGFDFENILNLGLLGTLSLVGLIAFMVGLFLFSHRMVLTLRQLALPRRERLLCLAAAALLLSAVAAALSLDAGFVLVFALLYAGLLDAFVHDSAADFGWVVVWLLVYALFSSALLFRYNNLKDSDLRRQYAVALATPRDTAVAEKQLPLLMEALQAKREQLSMQLKPWPFKADVAALRSTVNETLQGSGYLFQHYPLEVFAFDRENQPLLRDQSLGYEQVVFQNWRNAEPLPGQPNLRYRSAENGQARYMALLELQRMGDPAQPVGLYLFFNHEYPLGAKVYTQLFGGLPYKNLNQLARYDFAVQQNGQLRVEQGMSNTAVLGTSLGPGASADIVSGRRVDAVAKSADGQSVAAVGRSAGGWYKPIYLFSLLFTLASLFLLALAFANSLFRFLPEAYDFRLGTKGSLARRIHLSNVALLAVSFLVIGFLTYRHFTHSARDTARNNIAYRAEVLLNHLKSQALNADLPADSLRAGSLLPSLRGLAANLGLDANLFDAEGQLLFSTRRDLIELGILPGKMNPLALSALRQGQSPELETAEQSAGLDYFAQYLPLRNAQNQVLGYLGVPFQAKTQAGPEASNFLGLLASLYVFLLLIAFAVTYVLARSIVRPLSLLSGKVRSLKLEDKNEPLAYAGDAQDEVSELIGQYNHMVQQLEFSKVQLVRLEREGAWREMARQVAHDIKNPLTTMKLSMQQLERVSSNPEQAAAYLRKAITRLIEQIDSLAQIASEFSMFANLDIRNKGDVVINEVVENVHDLFSEQKNVELSLDLPQQRYHILGDKNHLIRVFNNLVINAIQAIPSDRQGHIRVSLSRQGNHAVIQISDNGGGIPPEISDRVFEPNFTTKTSGSGLGLAICKKIIEAHDGDIRFETRENAGTDFFVEVPVTGIG
jgi:signal transduction histidine kinase